MRASSIGYPVAILAAVVGMLWGIVMAAMHDHSTMPAHAHLNLLGWVSLFLFGLFYLAHPAIDTSRLARIQVVIWIIGTVILTVGVALAHTGSDNGEPVAGIGSIVVFAAMLLFGWIVMSREHQPRCRPIRKRAAPASRPFLPVRQAHRCEPTSLRK